MGSTTGNPLRSVGQITANPVHRLVRIGLKALTNILFVHYPGHHLTHPSLVVTNVIGRDGPLAVLSCSLLHELYYLILRDISYELGVVPLSPAVDAGVPDDLLFDD